MLTGLVAVVGRERGRSELGAQLSGRHLRRLDGQPSPSASRTRLPHVCMVAGRLVHGTGRRFQGVTGAVRTPRGISCIVCVQPQSGARRSRGVAGEVYVGVGQCRGSGECDEQLVRGWSRTRPSRGSAARGARIGRKEGTWNVGEEQSSSLEQTTLTQRKQSPTKSSQDSGVPQSASVDAHARPVALPSTGPRRHEYGAPAAARSSNSPPALDAGCRRPRRRRWAGVSRAGSPRRNNRDDEVVGRRPLRSASAAPGRQGLRRRSPRPGSC
jgi:hypothetical protein